MSSDPYFPPEHAHQLYDATAQPKELWLEKGFGHAENAAPDALLLRIANWLCSQAAVGPEHLGPSALSEIERKIVRK